MSDEKRLAAALERVEDVKAERDALAAHVERLKSSLTDLVGDSEGVYGLHQNGDPAPWGELLEGGRFEEWLVAFDETPTASLARLKAEWQAEALEVAAEDDWSAQDMLLRAAELRRQAQEDS